MCQESEIGLIGWMGSRGFVTEQFNPNNPQHIALMEVFADGCPECRAALAAALRAEPAPGRRGRKRRSESPG